MDNVERIMSQDKELVPVPDLSWLDLSVADKDNIPAPMNVEILPQLQQAWSHTSDRSTELIPNVAVVCKSASQEVSKEAVDGLVRQAKRDMMMGLTGKALASKLASLYMPEVIRAAKEELTKLSAEQGLLGNVYLDMTAFDSCSEAARVLGKNRVRTAKFVLGKPTRHACATHAEGNCREMNKKVLSSLDYDHDVLEGYQQHLRVAGTIGPDEKISSKEDLREAFLRKSTRVSEVEASKKQEPVDIQKLSSALASEFEKNAAVQERIARQERFLKARPVLAYVQDQMLRGKIGNALKESIRGKFLAQDISEYAPEIKRMASLQGLLGNVYVDVSYYRNPDEAISAIKSASTSPLYLVQTVKNGKYDDTLDKVARATGCVAFPANGKIDKSVALSYLSDLRFSDRISSEAADSLMAQVEAGSNVLAVIRDAFMATQSHKKQVREGGVKMSLSQGVSKKATDRDNLKRNAVRALEAGVEINKLEDKLASIISTPEAIGMTRDVLASMDTVDANCLNKCASEKYQLKYNARIKKASKCEGCIYQASTACTQQGVKFAGVRDMDKAFLDLDPKTDKVQFKENPDVEREDMKQEYDISDSFGSGMNIALDEIRKKESVDIGVNFNREGLDGTLSDM
jgi:hypothetical protein